MKIKSQDIREADKFTCMNRWRHTPSDDEGVASLALLMYTSLKKQYLPVSLHHNHSIVAHQNHRLLRLTKPPSFSRCWYGDRVPPMSMHLLLSALQMHTPTDMDTPVTRRRWMRHLERDFGCPSLLLLPPLYTLQALLRQGDWSQGSSLARDQCSFSWPWKCCILTLPLGTNCSWKATRPKICCHIFIRKTKD